MDNYFRLNSYCYLVRGKKNGCIYNLLNGKMTIINNEEVCNVLELCEKNIEIKCIPEVSRDFLNKLQKLDIGMYYDKPVYIDKLSVGIPRQIENSFSSNYKVTKLYIELDNVCNFNCNFCKSNDDTLYRKTGCKRWKLKDKLLGLKDWKSIIEQASKLSCEHIVFVGGEPLLRINDLQELCGYIKEKGIDKITIHTNGSILNDNIIQFIKKYNIVLNIQILGISNLTYEKITGFPNLYDKVYNNIESFIAENIDFDITYLITRDNDTEVEIAYRKYLEILKPNKIKYDFIYPVPQNDFYSEKYKEILYDKKSTLNTSKLNAGLFCAAQKEHNCYSNQIAITGSGDVLPCIMSRKFVLGNVKKDDLVTIYRMSDYEFYKNLNKDKIKKCSTCSLRYGCFDCRALEYSATEDLFGMEFCTL